MTDLIPGLRLAALALAAALTVASPRRAGAEPDPVTTTAVVEAPVDRVWDAWTTSEGFSRWAVPVADIDLRIGGHISTSYDPSKKPGDPGTISSRILSFEPGRMLSFQTVQTPDASFDLVKQTWCVVTLEALGPDRTRVTVNQHGWGQGPEWDRVRDFFEKGNRWTLDKLVEHFQAPGLSPPDERDQAAWARLLGMASGDWIFENTTPDGGVFRGRSIIRPGPGGATLTGNGWLGGAQGMFYHNAMLAWREPGAGVRFDSFNESGARLHGFVRSEGDAVLVWHMTLDAPGRTSSYRGEFSFRDPDTYDFAIFGPDPVEGAEPMVRAVYRRVTQAPPEYLRLVGDPAPEAGPSVRDAVDRLADTVWIHRRELPGGGALRAAMMFEQICGHDILAAAWAGDDRSLDVEWREAIEHGTEGGAVRSWTFDPRGDLLQTRLVLEGGSLVKHWAMAPFDSPGSRWADFEFLDERTLRVVVRHRPHLGADQPVVVSDRTYTRVSLDEALEWWPPGGAPLRGPACRPWPESAAALN